MALAHYGETFKTSGTAPHDFWDVSFNCETNIAQRKKNLRDTPLKLRAQD